MRSRPLLPPCGHGKPRGYDSKCNGAVASRIFEGKVTTGKRATVPEAERVTA